jgi:hypothetical protein
MATKLTGLFVGLISIFLTTQPPEPRRKSDGTPIFLRQGALSLLSFMRPILLDAVWLRTINIISDVESPDRNLALYLLGKSITDADPKFRTAYYYTALNVPYLEERDKWLYGGEASSLLRSGLMQFPLDLQFSMYLGFNLYFVEKKFKEASAVFLAGSKLKGAPPWMPSLATRLLSHEGSAGEALALAEELAATATDDAEREEFETRIRQLKVEVLLQHIDRANSEFEKQNGRPASTLHELQKSGLYAGSDVDEQGGTLSLSENGRASSSSLERRIQLYE